MKKFSLLVFLSVLFLVGGGREVSASLGTWTDANSPVLSATPVIGPGFTFVSSSSDGTKLAAVVSGGYIYTSTDGGATWTERTSAGSRNWRSITSSSDGTKLAAVVSGGYIYTSADGGVTWVERTSAGNRAWYSVASSSDGQNLVAGVASSAGGYIYTSTDGGATWIERTSAGNRAWYSVASSSDGTKLVSVANGGYLYTSTDGGATWTERTSAGSRSWTSITSSADGTKLAAVGIGGIYTSIDGGITWNLRTYAGDLRVWRSISSSVDGTKLAAVVEGGYIYTSTDGGATWTVRTSAVTGRWYSISSSADGTKLAAVVQNGYIYTSTDGGATWVQRSPAPLVYQGWQSVSSSSDGTKLAAVVYGGYIYTSADGGVTWVERTSAGSRGWISISSSADGTKLAAAVSLVGVSVFGSYIYTSTDGGATWVERSSAGARAWRSISSSPDGTKIAALELNSGYIYISTDGGVTWTARTSAGPRRWSSVAFSADGTKLAATVDGGLAMYVHTSTDSGVTWTPRTSSGFRVWRSISSSADGTKIAAVVEGGYIYTSTNGGATWIERTSAGVRNWRSIASSTDGTKLYAVVFGGYIYTSTDGGATWTPELVPGVRHWTSIDLSADGNRAVATAEGSRILTYVGGVPPVTTDSAAVDATTGTAATLYGSVLDLVGTASANVGFQYATDAVYLSTGTYTTTTPTSSTSILGSFNQSISGLACNTLYHYRAYSTNSLGTVHGVDKLFATFTTAPCGTPSITTNSATDISQTGATLKGTLTSTGSAPSVTTYFRYSTTSGFSSGSTATASVVLSASGALSAPITGLTCNTPYFYRAYAETGGVISALGSEVSFTTSACPPSVTTLGVTSVGFTSGATLNGNLTSTGGSSATVSFEYGTTTAYGLVATPSTPAMTAPAMFSASVTSGLSCNTTYNYRARAVSPSGTVFGSNQTFVTPCPTPGITTGASGSITTTSASVYGTLTSLGGAPSATTYFVYGTTSGLSSGGISTTTAVMPTAGPFTRSLTGLSCSTTYYYRAYATISGGLGAVGSESSFTTAPCATPTVATGSATGVTTTDAVLWGNLTSLGLAPSVVVGVEYGTTPTYGTVPSGATTSTLGPYGVSVSGLSCGTVYYYRAYVTGPAGTVYGSGGVFNTLPCPPVSLPAVTTVSSGSVTATSAVLSGNLTSLGGLPSVNVNFQYATASGFPSGSTGTASLARTATGAFTQTVTGLSCGTTYFFRAYATSSAPIGGVGSELSFTTPTCSLGFSATTLPASSITPTSAVLNGSLASSLTSGTSVGFEYGLTPSFGTTIVATTPAPSLVSGLFSSIFATGLTCNTTYHYRARATNAGSTVYGVGMTFTTAPCPPAGMTVTTVAATSVTSSTAILRGSISGVTGASSAVAGFEYGTTTAYGSTATAGTLTSSGPFTQSISGLLCGTAYSFRAYATSTGGTATGANVVFTTDPCGSPAVYTGTASLSGRTATLNGLLTFIASWPSATVGFEYGTTLTYGSTATVSPAMVATGSFSLPISGLACDTTYYYRAIASGAGGTAQGTRSSFIIPRATCLTGGGVGTDTGAGAGSGGGVRSVPIGGIVTYGSDTPIAQEIADYFAEISFDTLPLVQPARETTPPEAGRTAPRISLNVISSRKIDEDTVVATVSWTALNIAPKTCVGTSTPAVQGWNGETKEPSEDMRPGISRTYQEIIVGIKQEAKISLEGCVGTDGTKIVPASVTVASELAETAGMPAGSEETPRGGGGRNVIIEQI